MRFAIRPTCLALALTLMPAVAWADNIPKDIGLTKQAIVNLHIAEIWKLGGTKGIAAAGLPATRTTKIQKNFAAAFDKAAPGWVDKLAAREAAKFSSAEIADIERLTEVPSYQGLILAGAEGKPTPDVNKFPADELSLIGDLGNRPHVKKFIDEVLKDAAADKALISLIKTVVVKTP